jgi:polyhydroxyalkanoate synthesis regulator phasin
MYSKKILFALLASAMAAPHALAASAASEERNLNELRNTVVNLLEGLVARGVLTKDQAQQMVRDAQEKATADATAAAQRDANEKDAVRVPYVPQIVKDEIRKQVASDLQDQVTRSVVETAQSEGWGVPASLPDWVQRMRWSGDVRVRAQGDLYSSENFPNSYLDFLNVNDKGGIGKAGLSAFANTTEDRQRLRTRLRFGFDTTLGWGWSLGARISSGNLRDPVSTNQTLGNSGARYQAGIELAYLQWTGTSSSGRQMLDVQAGRIRSPWVTTDLLFDQDLAFEGLAASYRFGVKRDTPLDDYAYLTLGAFPLQEVELGRDKWLFAAQTGINLRPTERTRARLAAGVFDFRYIEGRRNTLDSSLLDYTAPQWMQRGNTLFDIRVDNDPNTNLFALGSRFRVADVNASVEYRPVSTLRLSLTADYLKNIGFSAAEMQRRAGFVVAKRTTGYQGELAIGTTSMAIRNGWRVYAGYRHLERDATLDAFTDSDFRLGGTDVQGYYVGGEWAITPRTTARLRYTSGNEIDGAPFGVDVLQLDMTAQF